MKILLVPLLSWILLSPSLEAYTRMPLGYILPSPPSFKHYVIFQADNSNWQPHHGYSLLAFYQNTDLLQETVAQEVYSSPFLASATVK